MKKEETFIEYLKNTNRTILLIIMGLFAAGTGSIEGFIGFMLGVLLVAYLCYILGKNFRKLWSKLKKKLFT